MSDNHYDVAVIGGGIVGLAHAWMASRRGLRVLLLERDGAARGASVRNFGMLWPIGQPAGQRYELALRSRQLWLELDAQGAATIQPCGSIHLAYRDDELAVLEEFCDQRTHAAELIRAEDVIARSSLANPSGLLGGMVSSDEMRVDPRLACRQLAGWLQSAGGVQIEFNQLVTQVRDHRIGTADGRIRRAERIIVCSGSDLSTLFPDVLADSGLLLCKLQMMMARFQPVRDSEPHLASGLTLRHYASFDQCGSLLRLKQRIAQQTPELDTYGIHVMASPLANGNVILGDSHQYGDCVSPFDEGEIDSMMLRELRKILKLPDWTMVQRWHGVYAMHPTEPVFERQVEPGVWVFLGTGGAGMTLSMGLAEQAWRNWTGASQ